MDRIDSLEALIVKQYDIDEVERSRRIVYSHYRSIALSLGKSTDAPIEQPPHVALGAPYVLPDIDPHQPVPDALKSVVDLVVDNCWPYLREYFRMNDGYTANSVNRAANTHHRLFARHWWHFVHDPLEGDEPGRVAYTPSLEYAKRDRQVVTKIGRYLAKYRPDIGAETIREIADLFKPLRLAFGDTAAHFRCAYESDTGSSCMAGQRWDGLAGYHPAEAYAGTGDFRIAVLLPHSVADDEPASFRHAVARAVVTRNKTYVRSYGAESLAIRQQLAAAGYTFNDTDRSDYNGLCLKAIRVDEDRYLMPYVDGSNYGTLDAEECVIRLSRSSGDFDVHTQSGYIDVRDTSDWVDCDSCGESHDPDDDDAARSEGGSYYCSHCVDRGRVVHAYVSHRAQDWIMSDNAIEIGDEWYLNEAGVLDAHGFVWCEYDDEWAREDDTVMHIDGDRRIAANSSTLLHVGDDNYGEPIYATHDDIDVDWRVLASFADSGVPILHHIVSDGCSHETYGLDDEDIHTTLAVDGLVLTTLGHAFVLAKDAVLAGCASYSSAAVEMCTRLQQQMRSGRSYHAIYWREAFAHWIQCAQVSGEPIHGTPSPDVLAMFAATGEQQTLVAPAVITDNGVIPVNAV